MIVDSKEEEDKDGGDDQIKLKKNEP